MKFLEYMDRRGERRLKRILSRPHRPLDTRMLVGVLFFLGYYVLVYQLLIKIVPEPNAPLVRDAMLVLGPVVGAIGQALFRSDVRDEIQASNTGEGFRAMRSQAEATKAAAEGIPPPQNGAAEAAEETAAAAVDRAADFKEPST